VRLRRIHVAPPPNTGAVTPSIFDLVVFGSCSSSSAGRCSPTRRWTNLGVAVSEITNQPCARAMSSTGFSITVLPAPRAPVHTVAPPSEPGPSSNASRQRSAITKVLRLRSHAADGLQLADLLTSAVTFEFRQSVGHAGEHSPKAQLALYVRSAFGVGSFLNGHRDSRLNVALYRHGR